MLSLYKMHIKRMISRREFFFVVSALLLLGAGAFIENCTKVYGWFYSTLNSGAVGWVMQMDQQPSGNTVCRVFVFFLFGILAAMVYGDGYCRDKQDKILSSILARGGRNAYLITGALAAFTGAFSVIFGFYFLTQLLDLLVFPIQSDFFDYNAVAIWEDSLRRGVLFPELFFRTPYLHNLLFMTYGALWAGVFGLMSYTASLYISNRLVVLGLPQLFLFLTSVLQVLPVPFETAIYYYLYPARGQNDLSKAWFFVAPWCVLLPVIGLLALFITDKKRKDYL